LAPDLLRATTGLYQLKDSVGRLKRRLRVRQTRHGSQSLQSEDWSADSRLPVTDGIQHCDHVNATPLALDPCNDPPLLHPLQLAVGHIPPAVNLCAHPRALLSLWLTSCMLTLIYILLLCLSFLTIVILLSENGAFCWGGGVMGHLIIWVVSPNHYEEYLSQSYVVQ